MSHTPGPWKHSKSTGAIISDTRPTDADLFGRDGADCLDHYGGYVVAESVLPLDQSLIAAAPDLLAACEMALRWMGLCTLDDEQETSEALRAAIAKANGTPPAEIEP